MNRAAPNSARWQGPVLFLYEIGALLLLLISLPIWLARALRHPGEVRERFGFGARPETAGNGRRPLWLHAASLGELDAAQALLEAIPEALRPPVIVTTLSSSARRRAARTVPLAYAPQTAPLDTWPTRFAFWCRVKPRAVVLIETELWPGWLAQARRAGVPVAVVSARISDRNWRRMSRFLPFVRALFEGGAAVVGAQTAGDLERLAGLGLAPGAVTGNLKHRGRVLPPRRVLESEKIWVVGSLRLGEECLLDVVAHAVMRRRGDSVVIAPRHLREQAHWLKSLAQRGVEFRRASEGALVLPTPSDLEEADARERWAKRARLEFASGPRVLYLDLHGQLPSWYALADVATIGGTFVPIGGHNLFEAARWSTPLCFGASTENVGDLADALVESGAATRTLDADAVSAWLERMDDTTERRKAALAAGETARTAALGATLTLQLLATLPEFRGDESSS